jgi:hypothetical protein
MVCTWCWSHDIVLVNVLGSSSSPDPCFPLGATVFFFFWFIFQGPALGQSLGLQLLL